MTRIVGEVNEFQLDLNPGEYVHISTHYLIRNMGLRQHQ